MSVKPQRFLVFLVEKHKLMRVNLSIFSCCKFLRRIFLRRIKED